MTAIETVAAELERELQFWWGHSTKEGWLVLDREDARNSGKFRHLIRCRDWSEFRVTRSEFGSNQFVGFKNHVQSLRQGRVQEACEQLLALRQEFCKRNASAWMDRVLREIKARKARLFGIACCRRIWQLLEEDCRQAVLLAERFVEGEVGPEEVGQVREELTAKRMAIQGTSRENSIRTFSLYSACSVLVSGFPSHAYLYTRMVVLSNSSLPEKEAEVQAQARLLRDIVGNPFRSVEIAPDWRTHIVMSLADSIYQERAFEQMPILADALEDSGCTNEDILRHCREEKDHVRGCWVVDLVRRVTL